jgi:putative ABC transport system permease protein
MYILKLAFRRILSRPGNSFLSLVLFAIGISIISLIIVASHQLNRSIQENVAGIDLVVGAKGSPLQLILSSVMHADYPTGNISLQEAERIANHHLVQKAIPLALGDSYHGHRIVGAPHDYAGIYHATLADGRMYQNVMEVVIGHNVSRNTGLTIGDTFYGVHGFQHTGHAHQDHIYTITGVFNPGAAIVDNLILTQVESVWLVHETHDEHHDCDHTECNHDDHEHAHDHHDHHQQSNHHSSDIESIRDRVEAGEDISREEMEKYLAAQQQQSDFPVETKGKEITSMLLFYRSPAANIQLPRLVNESTSMQAASPAIEINRLFSLLSVGFDILKILAWVIIVISGINLFVNLWNTLRQGISEIALMRVIGAAPHSIFMILIGQGLIISVAGWATGILLSRAISLFIPTLQFMSGTAIAGLQPGEWLLLLYASILGVLASFVPALKAYRTDVHFTLTKATNA